MAVDMNMKILIVDDYKTMLRIVRNLLHQLNFSNVDEATNGAMALSMLKQEKYDLVISDWNMQPVSGIELLREMRDDADLKHIPFIMVTAESTAETIAAAQQAGVSSYIIKPFNAEVLKERLVAVLGPF